MWTDPLQAYAYDQLTPNMFNELMGAPGDAGWGEKQAGVYGDLYGAASGNAAGLAPYYQSGLANIQNRMRDPYAMQPQEQRALNGLTDAIDAGTRRAVADAQTAAGGRGFYHGPMAARGARLASMEGERQKSSLTGNFLQNVRQQGWNEALGGGNFFTNAMMGNYAMYPTVAGGYGNLASTAIGQNVERQRNWGSMLGIGQGQKSGVNNRLIPGMYGGSPIGQAGLMPQQSQAQWNPWVGRPDKINTTPEDIKARDEATARALQQGPA
jgi:hypothetical protein